MLYKMKHISKSPVVVEIMGLIFYNVIMIACLGVIFFLETCMM